MLRRLTGQLIALNPDLIERVEATPDTVVTMIDDKKFLIADSLEDVLRLITDYRAFIIARSRELSTTDYDAGGRPVLHVVPDELVAGPGVSAVEAREAADAAVADTIEVDFGLDGLDDRDDLDDDEFDSDGRFG